MSLHLEERTFFKKIEWNLIIVILGLNVVGLINLFSATHGVDSSQLSQRFIMQFFWLTASWIVFFSLTFFDYKIFDRLAYAIYGLNVLALVAVPFIGFTSYGAKRWLDLGFFKYQPSETMKIALILVLARVLSRTRAEGGLSFRNLVLPLGLTLVPFLLVVKQPDLGTALMLAAVAGSMLLFFRVQKRVLGIAALAVAIAIPIAWNFGLKTYQKNRILNFVNPGRDPRGTGYNSIQSKIAVGSGQLSGRGYMKGTQSQLEFLPERETDFIYSVLSEEHGFIGSVIVLGLFAVLFIVGIKVASESRDKFGALLVVGLVSFIFWHMFVNIGMVIGLLPIVGVPLPILSYGGSSLLATMAGLGIVSSVAFRKFLF